MKKLLPAALIIFAIAFVVFLIRINQGNDEITIPNSTDNASSTEAVVTEVAEDVWLACSDKSRVKITYTENAEAAVLSFHDDVFTLVKVEAESGTKYRDDAKKLDYTEDQGVVTITQKGSTPVTCQPSI